MRHHVIVAIAAIGAATFAFAGCDSGSHQSATNPSTGPNAATVTTTTGLTSPGLGGHQTPGGTATEPSSPGGQAPGPTTVTSHQSNVPSRVPQNLTARRDVSATACRPAPGGYQMGGRIANTLGQKVMYKITAEFTDKEATVIGYGVTNVSVPAAATRPWSVTATFKAPSRVICVLRGVDT